MTEERSTHTEEPEKKPRPWRPTNRQVFWAIGMVVTLMTIALLVVQLYPGLWGYVSREPVALLKGRVATLIGIGVALTVLIVLLAMGSASLGWTGLRGKTLWDLLQLLIVPLVLVGIGLLFEMQQAERQRVVEMQQAERQRVMEEQQQALEDRRAKAERELADQRAQDEALQAYLDQMGNLLLEKDLRASDEYIERDLPTSDQDSEERTLARARTLTVLGRLDPSRKTAVIQFLVEAKLIQVENPEYDGLLMWGGQMYRGEGREPVIRLSGADLSGADFNGADVSGGELLKADLSEADLTFARLKYAILWDANLSDAELLNAELLNAELLNADLSGAEGITNEELDQQAASLEGATMPDGQKYEDWLKSKGRGEGENSGPS
jgi:hypothetical protein